MKIISKYVLREHAGPLTFALTALTSLMLLNFISRQFGELVGKGLAWSVIGEFLLLSIPFTVALTVPMSVLVAVLYAFSRLAAENEVTALKASGVSPWRMVAPAIMGGFLWSIALLAFNDQVLPRANHRLKVLQDDISQAKPTFLLKDQVINSIAEGKFYLKAGKIDREGASGRMREVVIYDLTNPMRRKTIYADSGRIALAANHTDLDVDLYHGQMQEVGTDKPGQLDRLFFAHDRMRWRGVTQEFKKSETTDAGKGDREMGVCEMQDRLRVAEGSYRMAQREYAQTLGGSAPKPEIDMPPARSFPEPHGIGWVYCSMLRTVFGVKEASAAELPALRAPHAPHARADTVPARDTVAAASAAAGATQDSSSKAAARASAARRDSLRRAQLAEARASAMRAPTPVPVRGTQPLVVPTPPARAQRLGGLRPEMVSPPATQASPAPPPAGGVPAAGAPSGASLDNAQVTEARLRLELAQRSRNRYDIEIHKKFSLAAACLIFAVLGAPLAVRFPRGGVGLVLGVSLLVFALYYVGLIGGEALANEGVVPPFWAMWGTNVILTCVGVVLLFRMGKDQNTGRGGDWADRMDAVKAWFGKGPRARRAPDVGA